MLYSLFISLSLLSFSPVSPLVSPTSTLTHIQRLIFFNDSVLEDVIGPILDLMDTRFCIDLWVTEVCTSISGILDGVANVAGAVMDFFMAPVKPLVDALMDIFLTPIELVIDALMAKVAPDFPFPVFELVGGLITGELSLPDALKIICDPDAVDCYSIAVNFMTPVFAALQGDVADANGKVTVRTCRQ